MIKYFLFPFDLILILISLNTDAKKIYSEKGQFVLATLAVSVSQYLILGTIFNTIIYIYGINVNDIYAIYRLSYIIVVPLLGFGNYYLYIQKNRIKYLLENIYFRNILQSGYRKLFWILGVLIISALMFIFAFTQDILTKL